MNFAESFNNWILEQRKIVWQCNSFLQPNKRIKLCFRGQNQIFKNNFIPSLYRYKNLIYDIDNIYSEVLAKNYYEFKDEKTFFDRLVTMQHFNIPTKLLDVTEDPLIALYFASKNEDNNDERKDGKIISFFISNGSVIYPNNPISTILSIPFFNSYKKMLFRDFNVELKRNITKTDIEHLINTKFNFKKNFHYDFITPISKSKNEINFNESIYNTVDLIGVFNAIPNFTHSRISRQKSSFLICGLSIEDSLLNTIPHYTDISFFIDCLKDKSISKILDLINKKDFTDIKCKEYLIEYLSNYIGLNICELDEYLPSFTIETYKELYSQRAQESPLYLEYLLFLYGIYGFEGKFVFYNDFIIPANEKLSALKALDDFNGINESFLFSDLEHYGNDIRNKYPLDEIVSKIN